MPLPTTNQRKDNVPRRGRGKRKAKEYRYIPFPDENEYSDIEVDEDGETWSSLYDTVSENGIETEVKRTCYWEYYYSTFVLSKINIDNVPMGIWYKSKEEFDRQEYGKSRTKVYFPSDPITTEVILYPHEGSRKEFVEYFRRNSSGNDKVKKTKVDRIKQTQAQEEGGASSKEKEKDEEEPQNMEKPQPEEENNEEKPPPEEKEEGGENDEGEAPTAGNASIESAQEEKTKAAHKDISGSSSSSGISLQLSHIFFEMGGAWEKLKTEELSLVDYIMNSFDESRHEDYLKYAFEMWSAVKGREFSEDHFLAFANEIHAKSPPERLGNITKERLIYRMCMFIGIASKTPTANFLDTFSQRFERNASDGDDWKKKYLEHMLRGWAMKHEGDVNMKSMEFFNFVKNISETINGVECMPPSA